MSIADMTEVNNILVTGRGTRVTIILRSRKSEWDLWITSTSGDRDNSKVYRCFKVVDLQMSVSLFYASWPDDTIQRARRILNGLRLRGHLTSTLDSFWTAPESVRDTAPPRWRSGGIHCTKCVWKSSSQALHSSMDLIVLLWLGGTVGERSPPPTRSKKYGVSVWCKEKIWSYFLQFPVCRLTVSQSTNFLSSGEWYISPFFCR